MIPIEYIDIEKLHEYILQGIQCQYKYVKVGSYGDASIICEYENGQPIFLFEAYHQDGVYALYPFKVLFKGVRRAKRFLDTLSVFNITTYDYQLDRY